MINLDCHASPSQKDCYYVTREMMGNCHTLSQHPYDADDRS